MPTSVTETTTIIIIRQDGVMRILGIKGQFTPVPEETVATIRSLVNSGQPVLPWAKLTPGKQIRVVGGPLAGAIGVILRCKLGKKRLIAGVEILGRSVCTELAEETVEADIKSSLNGDNSAAPHMDDFELSATSFESITFPPTAFRTPTSSWRAKMLNRLIKGAYPASGRKVSEKGNLGPPQSGRSNWWFLVAFILIELGLLVGCTGPSQQVLTAQALSQKQVPDPNKNVQNQLMVQATQASLNSYKDYQVGTEDMLTIAIYGQEKLTREVRVNGQGEITMPMVGVVKVAGMTPQEIEKRLAELYDANYLVNPQVTVAVKEFRHQRVVVTGAVAKPGSYEIIGPRTLLEVLALAGGFSNIGSPTGGGAQAGDVVNVIRHQNAPDLAKSKKPGAIRPFAPKTETMVIDLRSLVSGQEPDLNIAIRNGDVVNVPFAGTAYVLGAVKKPGNIAVKENLTVSQAVAIAGGIDPMLGTNSITIMRFDDQGKPISINTNLSNIIARSAPDLPLKNSDVVVVNESSIKKAFYLIKNLFPLSGGYSMAAF